MHSGIHQGLLFGADRDPSRFACTERPPCEVETTGLKLPVAKSDPLSSQLAAHEIEHSGKRRRQIEAVVEAVRNHPGHTSNELSYLCPTVDRYTFARRLPEAETLGLVQRMKTADGKIKMKVCTVSGKMAMMWGVANSEREPRGSAPGAA